MRLASPVPADREPPRSPERAAGPGAFAAALAQAALPAAPPEPSLPELREAARAIPAAIWAGRVASAPALELAFGPDLAIELRRGEGGLEVTLSVAPPLARAARADLPALARALEARGLRVSRAVVRARGSGAGPKGAGDAARPGSVDGGAPLR
jgi:hypothetical protein